VTWDAAAGTLTTAVYRSFAELLAATEDAIAIGVDIPIGLVEGAPRRADAAARRLLGPRRNSVFPAPDPRLLDTGTYAETLALARTLTGRGISRQAHAIYPKIAEVDRLVTPALQSRVIECHPEVAFTLLAGAPMAHPKRTAAGYDERRAALERELGIALWDRATARSAARPATPDDLLDAVVVAWSAHRFATGEAISLPDPPEFDTRGRRCEIVA
jgi:predicted RNase H-like nuclease